MSTPQHPTDEQLSAALDGQDPGASAHASGCSACAARLDALRAVIGLVAAPVPVDEVARERAIAAALSAPMAAPGAIGLTPVGPDRRRWRNPGMGTALAAVAALILVLLIVPRLGFSGGDKADTAARSADEQVAAGGSAEALTQAAVDGGDLGAVADSRSLGDLVAPSLRGTGDANASAPEAGATTAGRDVAAASTTTTRGAVFDAAPARAKALVGRAPCADVVAKEYSRGLGPLLYSASLTWQGKPAVVLGYRIAQPTGTLDFRLFVLARPPACTLLTAVSL